MSTTPMQSPVRDHRSLTPSQKKEVARIEKICNALAARENVPAWAKTILVAAGPVLSAALQAFDAAMPHIIYFFTIATAFYQALPVQALTAIYGFAICFFGGHFAVSLAAAEAFRISGGERVNLAIQDLYSDFLLVSKQIKADSKKDDDADGVADVDQISAEKLISRRVLIVLKNVNPDRCMQAIGALAQAFAGVIATLKVQFAKTVALAVSISDQLRKPAGLLFTPMLASLIPPDYHHWVSPIITIACKIVGMWVAWLLARVMATYHSSMIGGLMCARALFGLAKKHGFIQVDMEDSMVDEVCGWVLCAMGIYFQVSSGFTLSFPLNLILFPLSVIEWLITFAVTWFE